MNKNLIRIIAAACFVPLLVTNIQTLFFIHAFDMFKLQAFGPALLSVVLQLLPAISHLLIVVGTLFSVPGILGTGAFLMSLRNTVSLFMTTLPMAMRSHSYSSVIISALVILSYAAIALSVFIPKRGKILGIIAAAFSLCKLIVYPVFNVKLTSPTGTVITTICFMIGAVLIGIIFAEKAKGKTEA